MAEEGQILLRELGFGGRRSEQDRIRGKVSREVAGTEERTERLWEPEAKRSRGQQCPLDVSRPCTPELIAAVVAHTRVHKTRPVNNTAWTGKGTWASTSSRGVANGS